ncbi:unnamed protein product, partial [Mesorhabditis belari]|uniref:CUB domain-containing protein n=1 Tax=Mesorhabditis belari TaxID=2138241 RepID=A0AAF3EFY8_9BILA
MADGSNAVATGELSEQPVISIPMEKTERCNNRPTADCQWKMKATSGKGIRLKFHAFHLETDSSWSGYDYVEVYDGGEAKDEKLFGRFCSDTIPDELISTESEMLLVLHTDDSVEEKGFVAEYAEWTQGGKRPIGRVNEAIKRTDILNKE